MRLGAEHVSLADDRGERLAVVGGGQHHLLLAGLWREAVHVVQIRRVRQALAQRRRAQPAQLAPADVRQLQPGCVVNVAPCPPEAPGPSLRRAPRSARTAAASPNTIPIAARPRPRAPPAARPAQRRESPPSRRERRLRRGAPAHPSPAAAPGRRSPRRARPRARAPSRPNGGCPCRSRPRRSAPARRLLRSSMRLPKRAI